MRLNKTESNVSKVKERIKERFLLVDSRALLKPPLLTFCLLSLFDSVGRHKAFARRQLADHRLNANNEKKKGMRNLVAL
jgi:hypothetical protein